MKEHIYTIPLNDHFGKKCGCPLCSLFAMLETNEITTITGASMMEPSIRIKTNEQGFCFRHYEMMTKKGKRLPVALIMQSHLEEIRSDLEKKNGQSQEKYLDRLEQSCYVCNRINGNMEHIFSNLFHLYRNDEEFNKLFKEQPMFCVPHYRQLLKYGMKFLTKKEFNEFYKVVYGIEKNYLETLQGDIDWFCKKFDYRFAKEDWKNSKDSIERTVYTLTGTEPYKKGEIDVY